MAPRLHVGGSLRRPSVRARMCLTAWTLAFGDATCLGLERGELAGKPAWCIGQGLSRLVERRGHRRFHPPDQPLCLAERIDDRALRASYWDWFMPRASASADGTLQRRAPRSRRRVPDDTPRASLDRQATGQCHLVGCESPALAMSAL